MNARIIHPPLALSNHVRYFWSVEVDTLSNDVFSINTFVDDSSGIIFLKNNGKTALFKNDNPVLEALVYGQATIPTKNTCVASFKALGVLFYPHAITELFGTSASELVNKIIHLNDFLDQRFVDQVMESEGFDSQIQMISNFLLKKLSLIKAEDKLVKHSLSKIRSSCGILQVKELCDFYHLSERQFERRFKNVVGVSPRHYIKVIRFQEGINRIRSGNYKRLSQIAHELEYADQSHFIRHIKELSGINPKAFRDQRDMGVINLMLDGFHMDS